MAECTNELYNLAKPDCNQTMGRPLRIVGVSKKDSTGADNKITAGTVMDQAFIDTLVSELDTKKRWHISPKIKNFDSNKEDSTFQTYDDGSKEELREGIRSFTGLFPDANGRYVKYLKSLGYNNVYIITDKNVVIGFEKDNSGDVYPIPVELMTAKLNFTKGDATQNNSFMMEIPLSIKDEVIVGVYGSTGSLVETEGLIQMNSTLTVPTATGFTMTVTVDGQYGSNTPYKGLVPADLIGFDKTAGVPRVVSSVTSTAVDGTYIIVFTGAVSGNVMEVSESQVFTNNGLTFMTQTNTLL